MRLTSLMIGITLTFFAATSFARLPPKYLSVPHYKHCVSTVTRGMAQYICLPAGKPAGCPQASWDTLKNRHLVGPCLLSQKRTTVDFSQIKKNFMNLIGIG